MGTTLLCIDRHPYIRFPFGSILPHLGKLVSVLVPRYWGREPKWSQILTFPMAHQVRAHRKAINSTMHTVCITRCILPCIHTTSSLPRYSVTCRPQLRGNSKKPTPEGFWGINPFVLLIFASLDYCRFPWLKWQVNFFSFFRFFYSFDTSFNVTKLSFRVQN